MPGQIIKQISDTWSVLTESGIIECKARGKFRNIKESPVVGDNVIVDMNNHIINEILPRTNTLTRPVVANVDIALIVTSLKKPDLSLSLLDKQLVVIKSNNITPVICLTKLDLLTKDEKKDIKGIIHYYESIGIKVLDNNHLFKLKRLLNKRLVVLTGQTGAGKSSLLNKLGKDLNIDTSPISEALNQGVHTTRHSEIYKIGKIRFIDTPGFSALDLTGITKETLRDNYPEFKKYKCSFKDCFHEKEKGCEVRSALERKEILTSRYDNYIRFLGECNESSSKLYK